MMKSTPEGKLPEAYPSITFLDYAHQRRGEFSPFGRLASLTQSNGTGTSRWTQWGVTALAIIVLAVVL